MINAKALRDMFSHEMSRQQLFTKLYRKVVVGLETLNQLLEGKQEEKRFLGFVACSLHGLTYREGDCEFRLSHTPSMLDFPVSAWEMEHIRKTKTQIEEIIAFLKRH